MNGEELKLLKLIAKDLEDLQIMAAHIQDSIIPMMSMVYDPKSATFKAMLNRFCWEHGEREHEGKPLYHRVHSSLEIHHVQRVLHKGINFKGDKRAHNLLTIQPQDLNTIHLVFSGGPEIRVEVEDIHFHLGDLHHPWPTRKKPQHIYEHLEN